MAEGRVGARPDRQQAETVEGKTQTLRRVMEARSPKAGRREYVQVLRLLESFGLEAPATQP